MGNACCPQVPQQIFTQQPIEATYRSSSSKINEPVNDEKNKEIAESIHNEQTQRNQEASQKTILLPDGSKYVGNTRMGIPHGKGIEYHENGDKYTGDFLEGVKTGRGRYQYSNGILYEGEFKGGDIEGSGKMQWPNGDWYQGSFRANNMNGYGKYYSKQNESYYEGTYLDGKRHGKGIIRSNKNSLEGYWQLGVFKFKKVVPYQPI